MLSLFKKEKVVINEIEKIVVNEVEIIENMIVDIELGVEKEAVKQYKILCDEIGFKPKVLEEERFKEYLLENKIAVYDYKRVSSFLDDLYGMSIQPSFGEGRRGWFWCKLLGADKDDSEAQLIDSGSLSGLVDSAGSYQKAVPYHVLEVVKSIRIKFPEYIPYISEVVRLSRKPDPFLMYCFDSQRYVIKHWNEPNFKI